MFKFFFISFDFSYILLTICEMVGCVREHLHKQKQKQLFFVFSKQQYFRYGICTLKTPKQFFYSHCDRWKSFWGLIVIVFMFFCWCLRDCGSVAIFCNDEKFHIFTGVEFEWELQSIGWRFFKDIAKFLLRFLLSEIFTAFANNLTVDATLQGVDHQLCG